MGSNRPWQVGEAEVNGETVTTFPVPDFSPTIVHVRVEEGQIGIISAHPIVGTSGQAVTGLSNREGADETPFSYEGSAQFDFNVDGVDTEGPVRASDGTFWLPEEYAPSILHVDASGEVIARYVPSGLNFTGADYPIVSSLPGIYAERRGNRGFEGLAISPDGSTFSPLCRARYMFPMPMLVKLR